jgi:pimeloyl-ACP methyl ester carboxylesterase
LFDYRGSGYSDLAFEDMTFDTEMADLNAVIDFAQASFPEHRLGIFGVSFGCAVASAVAAERKLDINFMVFWCLSAELYSRYRQRLGPSLQERGYTYIDKGFKVRIEFLDSLRDRDVYAAIRDSGVPCFSFMVTPTRPHL